MLSSRPQQRSFRLVSLQLLARCALMRTRYLVLSSYKSVCVCVFVNFRNLCLQLGDNSDERLDDMPDTSLVLTSVTTVLRPISEFHRQVRACLGLPQDSSLTESRRESLSWVARLRHHFDAAVQLKRDVQKIVQQQAHGTTGLAAELRSMGYEVLLHTTKEAHSYAKCLQSLRHTSLIVTCAVGAIP